MTASYHNSKPDTNCLFITRRLLTGVSLNDKVQHQEPKDEKKNKAKKRNLESRPLTEEQKRKRREFFLKEEEWEAKVDLNILTDKGKDNSIHLNQNHSS